MICPASGPSPQRCCEQGSGEVICFCFWSLRNQAQFVVFLLIVQNCCPLMNVDIVSLFNYTFFEVCCLRRGSSRCKNCSERSQDPACLIHTSQFHHPLGREQTFRFFLQHMAVVNHTVWVTGVQVTPEKILIFAQDFPGGPVVKNLPSSVGDVGPIAGGGTKIP